MFEVFSCPNCGAPLKVTPEQTRAVCLYCSSTLQINAQRQAPAVTLENSLPEADMAQVKQHLLDGEQDAALELYIQNTGASPQAAQEALADLSSKLSLDVVRQQQLSPAGTALVVFYALVAAAGFLLWLSGRVYWLVCVVLLLYGVWMLYFYFPAIAVTLAFRKGKTARAQVLKLAHVGITRIGRQRVHVMKLLVEVQPGDGDRPYQAEMMLPVRQQNLERAQPGSTIQVKYLPEHPESVIYNE